MGVLLSLSFVSVQILVALACLAVDAGPASASSQLYELTADASIELKGQDPAPLAGTFRLAFSGLWVMPPGEPMICDPIAYAVEELDLYGDGIELRQHPLPDIPLISVIGYDIRHDEVGELRLGALVLERDILSEGENSPGQGYVDFRELRLAPAYDISGSGYGELVFDQPGCYPSSVQLNYVLQNHEATVIYDTNGADDGVIYVPHIEPGSESYENLGLVTIHAVAISDLPPPSLQVEIDIEPGRYPNRIRLHGWRWLRVAVLGSEFVDVDRLDVSSIAFGPDQAEPVHDLTRRRVYRFHRRDVNHDGHHDLLLHFRLKDTGIGLSHTEACLSGEIDGEAFLACDSVEVYGIGRQ